MKTFKIPRAKVIKTILFACLTLIAVSILPANQVKAGWMDNVIREGTDAILNPPDTGKDAGSRTRRACSSAVGLRSWQRLACTFGGSLVEILSEEDQKELAESTEETIATGQDSGWSNPNTGVQGEVKVTGTRINRKTQDVAVQDTVQEVPPLDLIAGEFRAVSNANIFAGPGTNNRSIGYITSGQTVEVIAKVQNQPWYLVSQDGIGSGYVDSNALKPTGRIKTAASGPKPQSQRQNNVKRVRVETKQTCKTVEQKVTMKDGSTHKNSIEACPEPDGTWDLA